MIQIRQKQVEKFYDLLDLSSMIYYNKTKKSYLESLLITSDNIANNTLQIEDLEEEDLNQLERLYEQLEKETFNQEEVRKAFLLALFKAFKHLDVNVSDITPDTIGILYGYFLNILLKNREDISVLDAACGTGNLLFSVLGNSEISIDKVYGVDINSNYINIAYHLANLLDVEVEFFNQNNLDKLLIPQVDVILADLPINEETNEVPQDNKTFQQGVTYKPYLMVDNLVQYCLPGGLMIYLIPNDFFTHEKNQVMKDILLSESYIQALIELPIDLFKDPRYQKSILILRKKGENIVPIKDILMLRFPSFKQKEQVNQTIHKIEQWFTNINK